MELKLFNELPNEAKHIRIKVFIEEQGFKNEFDEIDKTSHHIVCYVDGKAVGTARFFNNDSTEPLTYHLGRICVLKEYRKMHIGRKIIDFAENEIKRLNGNKIVLSSQVRAKDFYNKCGFIQTGSEYFDEYCPHIMMYKIIDK